MEIKKFPLHSLTLASFILQWVFYANTRSHSDGFIIPIIIAIAVHLLYFIRVIKRGENQYKTHFLYYQIGVSVIQLTVFSSGLTFHKSMNQLSWLVVISITVQVATCVALCLDDKGIEKEEQKQFNEDDDIRFKKGLLIVLTMIAFPSQLIFYGYTIIFSYDNKTIFDMVLFGGILLIILSVIVHINYLRAIKKGEKDSCFFYYQIGVAVIQSYVLGYPLETRLLFVLPLIAQVIAFSALYFHSDKSPWDRLPSYIKAVKQREEGEKKNTIKFPEIHVMLKT